MNLGWGKRADWPAGPLCGYPPGALHTSGQGGLQSGPGMDPASWPWGEPSLSSFLFHLAKEAPWEGQAGSCSSQTLCSASWLPYGGWLVGPGPAGNARADKRAHHQFQKGHYLATGGSAARGRPPPHRHSLICPHLSGSMAKNSLWVCLPKGNEPITPPWVFDRMTVHGGTLSWGICGSGSAPLASRHILLCSALGRCWEHWEDGLKVSAPKGLTVTTVWSAL